jgi:hypothetical protein
MFRGMSKRHFFREHASRGLRLTITAGIKVAYSAGAWDPGMGLRAGSRLMKVTAIAWVGLQLLSLCIAEQSAIYENESTHRIENSSAYTGRISVKKGHLKAYVVTDLIANRLLL